MTTQETIKTDDKLQVLPVGFDLGNGFVNLSAFGLTVSLPSGFMLTEPEKVTGKSGYLTRKELYTMTLGDTVYYVGQDILNDDPIREIDYNKLTTEYIRVMFGAAVALWQKTHGNKGKKNLFKYRLAVVAGMTPQQERDKDLKRKVFNAYRAALSNPKKKGNVETPFYVGSDLFDTDKKQRLHLTFLDVSAETKAIIDSGLTLTKEGLTKQKTQKGLTLVGDLGYGTFDLVLAHDGQTMTPKTYNLGMTAYFNKVDPVNSNRAEHSHLDGQVNEATMRQYLNVVRNKVSNFTRQLPKPIDNFILIGGPTHFIKTNKDRLREFNNLCPSGAIILNGDCNAKAFEIEAKKEASKRGLI